MMRRHIPHTGFRAVFLAGLVLLGALPVFAQTVNVAIEKDTVYVGEPFIFQIQVDGDDAPVIPELGEIDGFLVESVGGQPNNSQSVTIVNGRVTQDVRRSYLHRFLLTPQRAGHLQIPSVTVTAQGKEFQTHPVDITVKEPQESDDFKLRLTLSKDRAYVGEPIMLTTTWYFRKNVRDPRFLLPILQTEGFQVMALQPGNPQAARDNQVSVNGAITLYDQGKGTLDGQEYGTLTIRHALTPRWPGTFVFPEATVAFDAETGRQRTRTSRFGNSIFDDVFGRDRYAYQTFVTPSNTLSIEVLPLPRQGQPDNFSGLIGTFEVDTQATPTEVNVGDPITLTIAIRGGFFTDFLELPPLDQQEALTRDFRIPQEMAPPKRQGNAKVYTQIIRALHSGIQEIPPIALDYFDVDKGAYGVAKSKPIPITVRETTVVTSANMEGGSDLPPANELNARREGIAYNYTGPGLLKNQAYGPGVWLATPLRAALLILPPAVYAMLLGMVLWRKRTDAHPEQRRARQAYALWRAQLDALDRQKSAQDDLPAALLDALRAYLGAKLDLASGALTYADLRAPLEQRGVTQETLSALRRLYETCEAFRYAGGGGGTAGLAAQARDIAASIEKELKS